MGRLRGETIERIESYCDRVVRLAEAIEQVGVSRRICEQVLASGTSVGANLFEADEASSRGEFRRCVAISLRELNETRFWIRLIQRRGWVDSGRMIELERETDELRKILGAILLAMKRSTDATRDDRL